METQVHCHLVGEYKGGHFQATRARCLTYEGGSRRSEAESTGGGDGKTGGAFTLPLGEAELYAISKFFTWHQGTVWSDWRGRLFTLVILGNSKG